MAELSFKEKWTPPRQIMTIAGPTLIKEVKIYSPYSHPSVLVLPNLFRVDLICGNGRTRSFGFVDAHIDSFLRCRVSGYSINFEEVNKWEDAPPEGSKQ